MNMRSHPGEEEKNLLFTRKWFKKGKKGKEKKEEKRKKEKRGEKMKQ